MKCRSEGQNKRSRRTERTKGLEKSRQLHIAEGNGHQVRPFIMQLDKQEKCPGKKPKPHQSLGKAIIMFRCIRRTQWSLPWNARKEWSCLSRWDGSVKYLLFNEIHPSKQSHENLERYQRKHSTLTRQNPHDTNLTFFVTTLHSLLIV